MLKLAGFSFLAAVKFAKPPLSYAEQAALLIGRGLVVSDPQVFMRQLEAVGYYRLCAYWHPFKLPDSSFAQATSFDVVWNRYVFDRQLRPVFLTCGALARISGKTSKPLVPGMLFASRFIEKDFACGQKFLQSGKRLKPRRFHSGGTSRLARKAFASSASSLGTWTRIPPMAIP